MSHQNGRLARYTRWIFAGLFVGAAAGLLAPLLAKASPAVKEISAITSAEDYSSATVTFSVGAFSAPSGIGPLVPSDFSLTGTTATITSVTPVGSGSRTWDIAFSAPVAPHNAVLAVVANEVFESDGTAFPAQSKPVPLSATALSGLLTGLKSLDIPLYKETAAVGETPSVVNLPLVGGFFKNPGTDAEPAARGLDELLSGLSGISLGGSATQADLETALEGLAGVADAQFVGGGLTLAFDNTQTAATHTMSGAAGVDSLELSLKGEPSVALRLDGALRVLPSAGDIAVDAATAPFAIVLNSTAPVDLAAKMGFVGLSAPGASLAYSNARVSVDLGCTAGTTCAPSAMTSLVDVTGGTASLDIPKLTLTDGTGAHTYTPSGAPNLLEIDWTNLVDLKTAPTLANNLGNVANFANIDLDRAVASLQFMSAWLAEAEKFQAMGADLPLIGGKLSEQTRIAAALAEKIQAVTTGIEDDVEKKGVEVTAQDLVARLCTAGLVDVGTGSCDTALTPLAITPDHLDYKIDLDVNRTTGAGKDNIPLPTKLGLGIGDKLDGLALSEAAGPINLTSSGGLQFTLGLDLRPDATLMSIFGLEADDLDDDGTANGSDPDADGDGRDDATVDEDVDADGLPEKYALKPGDLCRGVGGLFGMAMERFAWLNGHALTGADRAVQIAACDDLAAPGTTVKYETGPDTDDPKDGNPNTVATATLTANDVCYAGATLFLVPDGELTDPRAAVLNTFRTFNGYGADNAACAAALAAGTSKFKYDNDLDFGSPVRLAHRAYVGESSTPVLNQAANLTGTGIEIAGRLGFLDIKFLGNVTAAPTASVKMVDPKTGADDDRISLIELAKAADADDLDSIINLTMGGPIDAHFALTNTSVLTTAAHLDVLGSFSALDNAAADIFEFHTTHLTDASSLTADRIHVAQDLGELLNFEDVGTPQIRQLIRRFAESMATMAGSSALDHEIPFIGVRPAEMLDFAKKWQAVGEQTLAGDPQTLSAFASALKGALASQGFSSDLDLDIDDHDFLIGLKGSSELTRSYPFSFDLSGFPIAPADGGATVNAKAALTFAPTLGMRFAPGGSG
ncbi:MAG: hypothetical protein QOF21_1237, partial [Actinomycetota bacterium]